MKEEERIIKLRNIEKKKSEMQELRNKFKILKQIEKDPIVKKYIKLKEELEGKEIIPVADIEEKEMTQSSYSCTHDIWFSMGGRRIEYDYGPESRDTTYYEFDEEKIEYYLYYCLECWEQQLIPKKENQNFLATHNVIFPKNHHINCIEIFKEYQKLYYKLLLTNSNEITIKKLMKRSQK